MIHDALVAAGRLTQLKSIFPQTKIMLLTEEQMLSYTGVPNFSGGYLPDTKNIALNLHIFDLPDLTTQKEMLTTLLANELSHAETHATHEAYHPNISGMEAVTPWKNTQQQKQLTSAYAAFERRIQDYQRLALTTETPLSNSELEQLNTYDATLCDYIPKRLGKEGYDTLQLYHDVDHANKKTTQYLDPNNRVPSLFSRRTVTRHRADIETLRTAFFREHETQGLMYQLGQTHQALGPYNDASEGQYWADMISDFDQLPPGMQTTFGPELCNVLTDFHQHGAHCDKPQWPTARCAVSP